MAGFSKSDETFMRMALDLAEKGRGQTAPNPMVGAVVVNEDHEIVGSGFHARAGQAHAEAVALLEAGRRARGGTLYVTLEPCSHHGKTPPCAAAVIESGVKRVVAAMTDPNPLVSGKGFEMLRESGVKVETGLLEKEARRLNEFFVTYHEKKRPFITIKWAMTACGRTAHDSGESRWISNSTSRRHGHVLRSQHDAVMVGLGTVLSDDPMLNVRLPDYNGGQPRKIVLDGDLSIPTRSRLLRERGSGEVIVYTTSFAKKELIEEFEQEGRRIVVLPSRRRLVDLTAMMRSMYELEIMSVLVEGGRSLHTALLRLGYADKLVAFVSPKIVGGSMLRNPVEDLEIAKLNKALTLNEMQYQIFENDVCMSGYFNSL